MHLLPETLKYWLKEPIHFLLRLLQRIGMKCRVGKEVIENTMGFREILGTAKLQPKPEIGKKKKKKVN